MEVVEMVVEEGAGVFLGPSYFRSAVLFFFFLYREGR